MAVGKPVKQLLSFKHHLQFFQGNAAKWIVCHSMPSQVDYLLQGIDGQACQPFVTICIIYVVILMCHPFITVTALSILDIQHKYFRPGPK